MTPLAKKLADDLIAPLVSAQSRHGPTVVRSQEEADWTPEAVRPHAEHLAEHLAQPHEGVQYPMEPWKGIQAKHVVETPTQRFMLKPYFEPTHPGGEREVYKDPDATATMPGRPSREKAVVNRPTSGLPTTGWAEMTHQALYHAAGIGHLHQQVHVTHQPYQGRLEPFLAIRMAPDHQEVNDHVWPRHDAERTPENPNPKWGKFGAMPRPGYSPELQQRIDQIGQDAGRIAVMDYLSGNQDRGGKNLMVGPDHTPLAIDHGRAFTYHAQFHESPSDHLQQSALAVPRNLSRQTSEQARETMGWWAQHAPEIRRTMARRLEMIKHPGVREHLRRNFEARADHLDDAVSKGDVKRFWDEGAGMHLTPGLPSG